MARFDENIRKYYRTKYFEIKILTGKSFFSNKDIFVISPYSTLISFKCRWVVIRKLKLCIKWIIIWYNLCQKISRNETILILKFIKKLMITIYTALKPHSYCKVILFLCQKVTFEIGLISILYLLLMISNDGRIFNSIDWTVNKKEPN